MSPNLRIKTNKAKKKISFGVENEQIFCWEEKKNRRGRENKNEKSKLLSSIHGVPSVGIRRAKKESLSTRRGLRVGTENTRFRRGFKRGVREIKGFGFRKCQ